jgi:hypothetical protein
MNQYQQPAYQQPVYPQQQQQQFGKNYGGGFVPGAASSAPSANGAQKTAAAAQSYAYGQQQFYPGNGAAGYEEDYNKANSYGAQQNFFGGQKTDYKPQQVTHKDLI